MWGWDSALNDAQQHCKRLCSVQQRQLQTHSLLEVFVLGRQDRLLKHQITNDQDEARP